MICVRTLSDDGVTAEDAGTIPDITRVHTHTHTQCTDIYTALVKIFIVCN